MGVKLGRSERRDGHVHHVREAGVCEQRDGRPVQIDARLCVSFFHMLSTRVDMPDEWWKSENPGRQQQAGRLECCRLLDRLFWARPFFRTMLRPNRAMSIPIPVPGPYSVGQKLELGTGLTEEADVVGLVLRFGPSPCLGVA